MTISQFWIVVKARWRTICSIAAVAVIVSLAISLYLPKQYTGTASVLIDVKSPDPLIGTTLAGMTSPAYMASQVDILKSERVAVRVLDSLGLVKNEQLISEWKKETEGNGDYQAWLAETLQKKLEVKPSRDSNAIAIAYTATDPEVAAKTANAFISAYIDTVADIRVQSARQYNAFFDARVKQLRAQLQDAQSKHSDFQRANGIIATDDRLDIEMTRLNDLSSQLVDLQALATESRSRLAQVSANAAKMPEVTASPILTALNTEMARLQGRLSELRERLGDQHPDVKDVTANIAQLKLKIDSETARASGAVVVNNNVNQSRLSELLALLDQQRAKVLRLKGQRDQASVLQRDVESAQREYEAAMQRVSQSSMESQSTQTNITLLKSATRPALASSPRIVANTAIALIVGTLLGLTVALSLEVANRRLRSPTDVTADLGAMFLVRLPHMVLSDAPATNSSRLRQLRMRILSGNAPAARKA